jgi:hypothetical protein
MVWRLRGESGLLRLREMERTPRYLLAHWTCSALGLKAKLAILMTTYLLSGPALRVWLLGRRAWCEFRSRT